ncbi:MAG TPA: PIG-L family deacetylase [Clostridiales bacterium]|nr:PIG-L family deacetylase [Clostridiales bacterium]
MLFKRVLVLAPHTDDGELGCGGTIDRLVNSGTEVHYAAFSIAERSVSEEYPSDILGTEVRNATAILGISKDCLHIYNYDVRNFQKCRQEILEDLVILNRSIDPDIIFLPSINDIHQDHHVIAREGVRAFKFKSVMGYELPWNNLTINTACFVELDYENINNKIRALGCYESQQGKKYFSSEFIKALAVTRGTQIGVQYAEVFEVIRWII